MQDTQAAVRAILPDWRAPADKRGAERVTGRELPDALVVELTGAGWLITGVDPYGVTHTGCRDDAIGLAQDLKAISEQMAPKNPLAFGIDIFDVQVPDSPALLAPGAREDGGEMQPATQIASDTGEAAASDDSSPPLYPGTVLTHDEVSRWRASLMLDIDNHAADLIEAAFAESTPQRQAYLTNGRMLGRLTDAETVELDRLEKLGSWRDDVRTYAANLKAEVAESAPDFLEIFDVQEGWPAPPGG